MLQLGAAFPHSDKDIIDKFASLLKVMNIAYRQTAEIGVVCIIQTTETLEVGIYNTLDYGW